MKYFVFLQTMQIRRGDSHFFKNLLANKVEYGFALDCGSRTPTETGEFRMDFSGTGFFLAGQWTTVSPTLLITIIAPLATGDVYHYQTSIRYNTSIRWFNIWKYDAYLRVKSHLSKVLFLPSFLGKPIQPQLL